MPISLDMSANCIERQILDDLHRSGDQNVSDLVSLAVVKKMEGQLDDLVAEGTLRHYSIKVENIRRKKDYPLTVRGLTNNKTIGLGKVWIDLAFPLGARKDITISGSVAPNRWNQPQYSTQDLKTLSKTLIKFLDAHISTKPLHSLVNDIPDPCACEPNLLMGHSPSMHSWYVKFVCRCCGEEYFCECFRNAMDIYREQMIERVRLNRYAKDAWPYQFLELYPKVKYREGICHVCRGVTPNLLFKRPMQISEFRFTYGNYIKKISIEQGISNIEAGNILRDELGISWFSERKLFETGKDTLPAVKVIHQGRPKWLGSQSLDIYVPELGLAIEYQGAQHYRPVDFFGGEEAFAKTKERDQKKASLCAENGIKLIYFRFDENVSKERVERKIKAVLG